MAMVMVLSAALVAALAVVLTIQIRDGLFNERLDGALEDAARATTVAQNYLSETDTDSPLAATSRAQAIIASLQTGSSADVVLLEWGPRTTEGSPPINPIVIDRRYLPAVSDAISFEASRTGGQVWQSVLLPAVATDKETPGLIVAAPVTILGTEYVLAFAYDLGGEEKTLDFIERVLLVGGAGIIAILILVTWIVAHRTARPIVAAAAVAERLTGGDFTERMEVRGEDELATLAASFNAMADSLQAQIERMEEMGRLQRRFVADVSHELRTPLATIRMAGDVIHSSRQDFPPALARSAELLATQIERFDALLADLLEISRFDANAANLVIERTDIARVVTGVLEELSPLADGKNVILRRHFSSRPLAADLDTRRVERIVRNLVANAIEHAEAQPVDIYLSVGTDAVALVVRDHGLGIPSEEVSHVFDRFWRADPARARTTGGTGLGLSIAREDARLHGGTLDAWGSPGQGASFRLILPIIAGTEPHTSPLALVPDAPEVVP
jgi:two-component system sensor histidine kinase MtrB